MTRFPPGCWDLADRGTFTDWANELKTLEPSKSLRAIVSLLYRLQLDFEQLTSPLEFDDYPSDDEAPNDVPAPHDPSPPTSSTILSKPRRKAARPAEIETAINDPKVSGTCDSLPLIYVCRLL